MILYPNYEYVIDSITDRVVRIKDSNGSISSKSKIENGLVEVSHDRFIRHFGLCHASTVHSSQGGKIDEPFIITDIMSEHVTANWLHSALTRCTKLSQIYVLSCSLKEINRETEAASMISGYMHQDRAKNRDFMPPTPIEQEQGQSLVTPISSENKSGGEFVDVQWILEKFRACGGKCPHCHRHMTFEKNNELNAKVTVNRLNNHFAHLKGNCELCCLKCNITIK